MTTKAFTLIEFTVIVAVIAIIAGIVIPNVMHEKQKTVKQGMHVIVKATKVKAVVVSYEGGTRWTCRIDNGPGSNPRYVEVRFFQDEIEELVEAEKEAP